ncbi:unnamed protein product, partial [Ixodes pacificus]
LGWQSARPAQSARPSGCEAEKGRDPPEGDEGEDGPERCLCGQGGPVQGPVAPGQRRADAQQPGEREHVHQAQAEQQAQQRVQQGLASALGVPQQLAHGLWGGMAGT